ncbi:VENN motif pre-toxin domain-containing protein [Rahnella laticis]|uniref:VENN motif pre-toxin domain-containing protein n=1 Tax=Rahnella laticis TaxID=2787622 RepID=UPI0018A2F526|nr:VENN motif pre-toxin domain-containing protein [Rahnella laticis]MBF7995940.1 VENN motif pre-toxin domain-containing protein [Rahnella laticis]
MSGEQITVGNHTQLNGGIIASGASADKNRLDTGTLGWNDIHNEASYSVDSSSISMSSGGNSTSQFIGNMANAMLAGLNGDGSASSTTGSAIAGGTIVIRDQDAQKQDVASLNRDTDNAHSTLAPIFDAAKEQQRIDENRAIAQIGSQVADIVRTEGKIAAQEAAKEQLAKEGKLPPTPIKGAEQSEWDAYNKTLENTDAYKAAMNDYGTGSNKQQAIQAITAAVQGLTGGDWSSAVAGAAAPYMAEFIKNNTAEGAERIISHALAGAIVAEMQGGNAAAGAAGAGLSAAGAKYIADQLYPGKDIKDLTEEQKQGVVPLATLASGIAGGVVGGDVNSAIDGAKAGKNEVENNALAAGSDLGFWLGKTPDCDTQCKAGIAKGVAEGNLVVSAGIAGVAGGAMIVGATPEIVAAAKVALSGCKSAPAICLNNAGLQIAEAVTPGGVGAAGAIGVGKTVAEATAAKAEAVAASAAINVGNGITANSIKNPAETQLSVDQKLANYLLDKQHPVGGSKAEWFDSAPGFYKTNSNELSKQIVFDPSTAIKTADTQFGTKYDQVISISGTNGRTINVKFGWIKNNDGVVRLVTAIPAKK